MYNTSSQFSQHPNEGEYFNNQPNALLTHSHQQYTDCEQEPLSALGYSENYVYRRNSDIFGNPQHPVMNGQLLSDNPPSQPSFPTQSFQNNTNPLNRSVGSHASSLSNSFRSFTNHQLTSSVRSDGNPLANSVRSDVGISGLSRSTCSLPRNDNSTSHISMNTPIRFNGNSRGGYPYQSQQPHPSGKNDKVEME